MHTPSLLVVPLLGTAALAREIYAPLFLDVTIAKRQQVTCDQVYGVGVQLCGGPESIFCYNPSLGQSCCPDRGFCRKGNVCSPMAGYCCDEGEDLAACAQRGNITVPAATTTAACGVVSTAASLVTVSPFPETPAVTASPTEVVPVNAPAHPDTPSTPTEGITQGAPSDQGGARDETVIFSESVPTSYATESFVMPNPFPSSNHTVLPTVEVASAAGNAPTLYWGFISGFMVGLWSAC